MKFVFALLSALLLHAAPLAAQQSRQVSVANLFDLLEANSSALAAQKTGVEMADKGIASAKAQRLPDINASASVAYLGDIFMTDRDFSHYKGYSSPHLGNTLTLQAEQVVYAGGAISAGIRLAELKKQAELAALQSEEMHSAAAETLNNNSQVRRHITPVNTRVHGFIKEIRFEEYQRVRAGDTLMLQGAEK